MAKKVTSAQLFKLSAALKVKAKAEIKRLREIRKGVPRESYPYAALTLAIHACDEKWDFVKGAAIMLRGDEREAAGKKSQKKQAVAVSKEVCGLNGS
jgi:hypothetical protein